MQVCAVGMYSVVSQTAWRTELQRAVRLAGEDGAPVMALLGDVRGVPASCMADIESVAATGTLVGLFSATDYTAIFARMRRYVDDPATATRAQLHDLFCQRVRRNIRFVVCMRLGSHRQQLWSSQYRTFFTAAVPVFVQRWQTSAIEDAADHILQDVARDLPSSRLSPSLASVCTAFHELASEVIQTVEAETSARLPVTAVHLIRFVTMAGSLSTNLHAHAEMRKAQAESGLTALQQMNTAVVEQQFHLRELKQPIESDTALCAQLRASLAEHTAELEAETAALHLAQSDAESQRTSIATLEEKIKTLLAGSPEGFKKATDAAAAITRQRAYRAAWYSVAAAATFVLLLKHSALPSAAHRQPRCRREICGRLSKTMMDPALIGRIRSADPLILLPEAAERIRVLITNKHFKPREIAKVVPCAKTLCAWLRAADTYYFCMVEARPCIADRDAALAALAGRLVAHHHLEANCSRLSGGDSKAGGAVRRATERLRLLHLDRVTTEQRLERAQRLSTTYAHEEQAEGGARGGQRGAVGCSVTCLACCRICCLRSSPSKRVRHGAH